ncbi:VWA domain-containing protein [Crocinitomicaceae bacterium]|nr:VWA domain-containing protein [Crocinitomicaceae bacterium]
MNKYKYTYNIKWIAISIIAWEFIFWCTCYFIPYLLGLFNDENSNQLIFKQPKALLFLLSIAPLSAIYIYSLIRFNKRAVLLNQNVQQSYLNPVSTFNSFFRFFLYRNAISFLILAMAIPTFGTKREQLAIEDLELVICLDISSSMNAKDISNEISRLNISKRAINQLINNLNGERIGICLFANNAFAHLPITRDYEAAKMFVNGIETNMLSSQGTNINAALQVSMEMFSKEKTGKGIVLISDGENHENDPSKTLTQIRESNINLIVLGIGTRNGGLVPKDPNRPERGFKTTASGKTVLSKLNAKFIQEIATTAGGQAFISSNEFPNLSALLTQINQIKRTKMNSFEFDLRQERYRLPLLFALIFMLLHILWSKRSIDVLNKLIK